MEVTSNPFVQCPIAISDQHFWLCRFKPSHAGPGRFSFTITEFDQSWSAMDLLQSRAKPCPTPQTNKCVLQTDTHLMSVQETGEMDIIKFSAFCPQYFCSFWLNLFFFFFFHSSCLDFQTSAVFYCHFMRTFSCFGSHPNPSFLAVLFHNKSSWMTK